MDAGGRTEIPWFQSSEPDDYPDGSLPVHEYGRLRILDVTSMEPEARSALLRPRTRSRNPRPVELTRTEELGLAALRRRHSRAFQEAKRNRRFDGRSWGSEKRGSDEPEPLDCAAVPRIRAAGRIPRLTGRIAIAVIFVSGPGRLAFSESDTRSLVAEVQAGAALLNSLSPLRDLRFAYEIAEHSVGVPEAPASTPERAPNGTLNIEPFEGPWRDAALAAQGFASGTAGVRALTQRLRDRGADWAFAAFFTKYRLAHYAYAMDNRKVVMGRSNRGWEVGNVDRVFAHEAGHIFGAPDEYGGCTCTGAFGPFGLPNTNCTNCAPGGGIDCLMRNNTGSLCRSSRYHLGFNGLPPPGPGV